MLYNNFIIWSDKSNNYSIKVTLTAINNQVFIVCGSWRIPLKALKQKCFHDSCVVLNCSLPLCYIICVTLCSLWWIWATFESWAPDWASPTSLNLLDLVFRQSWAATWTETWLHLWWANKTNKKKRVREGADFHNKSMCFRRTLMYVDHSRTEMERCCLIHNVWSLHTAAGSSFNNQFNHFHYSEKKSNIDSWKSADFLFMRAAALEEWR